MKKIILFILLTFTLLLVTVRAEDLHASVDSSDVWFGDSVAITCWYSGINTTSTPYAFIENINQHTLWEWNEFTQENETHYYTVFNPPLLGTYRVICTNGIINSSETTFKLSELTLSITDYPEIAYLGKKLVVNANVIKTSDTDVMVTTNVNFDVFLNNEPVQIDNDATYCLGSEWVITTENLLDSEFNPSSYTLKINANYIGESASSTKSIQIKNPVEFELIDVDKTEVLSEDNISITLKAMEKGNPIPLEDLQLKFQISDKQCTILKTTRVGNNIDVVISVPSLSPGSYSMLIKITYNDHTWEDDSVIIDYGVPITVDMKDSSNNVVATQFRFLVDDVEKKKFTTGSDGSFSGYIPPGTYDIELTLPNSKLTLYDVVVNGFDNPIKFDHPSTDLNIAGVGVGEIYVFEVALSYSKAYLKLNYDSSKILNENEITVYKCENWNFGRKICSGDWRIVGTEIDTIRDVVSINTSSLSAFLVGYKKEMDLIFDTDKDEYCLSDIIKVSGIVEDEDRKPVSDVQITASIPDIEVSASGKTDNAGVFAFELIGPDQEGTYDILVLAEKSPFSNINTSKSITVVRSSQLSLSIPESVKINQGDSYSMWVSLVNTGQTDFSSLTLSLSGIPEEYYTLPEINELKAGEKIKVSVDFSIPENAGKASHTGKLKITYDGDYLEEQFILTVLSAEENETTAQSTEGFKFPSLSLPTAKIVLPSMGNEAMILAISSILIFSSTVLLKKRRIVTEFERKNVKNLLLDIKREVERFSTRDRSGKGDNLRWKLIRFRKALKNKKLNDS